MTTYLKIEENKHGEIDFAISGIEGWDYKKQRDIRNTLITAIYILEEQWRRQKDKQEQKPLINN